MEVISELSARVRNSGGMMGYIVESDDEGASIFWDDDTISWEFHQDYEEVIEGKNKPHKNYSGLFVLVLALIAYALFRKR